MTDIIAKRHAWSERNPVDQHTTFRRCWDCGLIKITRHEFEGDHPVHWTEWRKDGKPFRSDVTPACEPASNASFPPRQSAHQSEGVAHSNSSPLSRLSTGQSS